MSDDNNNNNPKNENNDVVIVKGHTRHRSQGKHSSIEIDDNNSNNDNIELNEIKKEDEEQNKHRSESLTTTITREDGEEEVTIRDDDSEIDRSSKEEEGEDSYSKMIKLRHWWWFNGYSVLIVLIFIGINLAVAIERFYSTYNSKQYQLFGLSVCFARCSAAIINLNTTLILLPVLRNVVSWVRGTWVSDFIPIDRHISFHKLCAFGIIIGSIIHCVSHYNNFRILLNTSREELIMNGLNGQILDYATNKYSLFYRSVPGLTGHLMIVVLVLIVTSSIERIRRPMFEVFYYTHHLFAVYFVLICFHGISKLFQYPQQSYYWAAPPFFFYLVERIYRIVSSGTRPVLLHMAKQHPSKVLELRLKTDKPFKYNPGQYLYLNCPSIANHEWHPFTITSSPDEPFISVHINIVGNWTGKLYKLLNANEKLGIVQNDLMKGPDGKDILRIDGPFGASCENVFKYRIAVLIGAGIGATPFSSILKHVKYQLLNNNNNNNNDNNNSTSEKKTTMEKVYFFWISREKNSFEWFTYMLNDVERSLDGTVEIHSYLTGSISISDWNDIVESISTLDTECHSDFITGLRSQTLFGRPNWDTILQQLTKIHENNEIGLFFCGPRPMEVEIKRYCRQYNGKRNCHLHFYKEHF
ncbi:superoxide-generating NADPH oxidase flavocytochrome [Cavenderia fasciculata]|uniref:Superoxide-generating NADPH oxidase flavocytochrome n=1 Tax=Cavenderia fasciculata TaxID=261658 RepID=F4QA30_CACFS|nr:superoxide-generating NADPH oxidase flavocytochrome [Cavenderia fasciculata]EGG15549.1 superoxide-generating NADPH oxidase flavocytochrome [Cavenderia fasciculata]|eukprot:XP_004354291.1 superoxide-generating NADPH oxidase flavocytochrome [Cavenderia fasciculata]